MGYRDACIIFIIGSGKEAYLSDVLYMYLTGLVNRRGT